MSTSRRAGPPSVERRLFNDAPLFDFFQAVRLLHRLAPDRTPVGGDGPPWAEPVRFRAHLSLSFPPSSIYEIRGGFDLYLVSTPGAIDGVLEEGKNVVTVTILEHGLRFRIFDALGMLALEADEKDLPDQAEAIDELKIRLKDLWPPHHLAQGEKNEVVNAVASILNHGLHRPVPIQPVPELTQAFLGLVGPSGVLPRHYTELVCRLHRETAEPEADALRDWLDLFQNRFTALFFKSWEKYRFPLAFERGESDRLQPDLFTRTLYALIGLGFRPLRDRLTIARRGSDGPPLARISDLSLLYYSGLLAHHPRNALSLEAILHDFFELPVSVRQFQGEWLLLDEANRTRIGEDEGHNQLGLGAIVGDRVWEVKHKIRVRLGPLSYRQFEEFLPDQEPVARRKAVFLLAHLVRLYAGPELDFDVQLVLAAAEVPETRLTDADGQGSQLGWNTWLITITPAADAEDAVLEGVEVFEVG
jgi:type VI secretion system protein ImpH